MTGRRLKCLTVLAVLALVAGAAASADSMPARQQDPVDELLGRYNLHAAFDKGGRGLSNFFFGWLEVPLGVHRRYAAQDTAGSFFTGLGLGFFKGLVRTGVGIYETVTFFLPYPEHFAPILPTLEYFQKPGTPGRKPLPLE